ncbi:hypothetical protein QLX67_10415, partial [Balneolaceae bacterium ANBcel3]|nr:hypothetical protein [Balneolaceae bacterium ANBcel3]
CITPSREIAEQLSATRPIKTAYISGWAATRNITSGHAIPLSDHIDFFELLDLCQTIAPRHVWLTHSPDPSVALHFLRQAGISCHPLQSQKLPPNLNDVKRVFSAPNLSSISTAHDAGKRDDHAFPFTWQRHGAFALFCETFVPGPHAASPDDTITRYADYLGALEKESLCLAIRFLTDGPLPPGDKTSGAASQKLLLRTMSRMLDIGIQEVIKPCREAVSHVSEAAGILFQNMGGKVLDPRGEGFSLKEVQRLFQHLASMRFPDEKSRALEAMWIQMTPEEIRGSVQILTRTPAQGALFIPFLIRALSAVFDVPVPHLSRHFLKTGRLDAVAALAADRRLANDGPTPKSRVLTASVLYIRSLPGTDASECTVGIRRSPVDSRFVAIANTTMISSLLDGHQLKEKARSYYEERFGPAIRLKPGLMVEVQYAGILENRRKQAGIELFMPEIVRIAEDKDENHAFTLSGLGVDGGVELDSGRLR